MGNAAPDNYTHPTRAPQAWWDRLRHVVEEIFIVGGADEIFVDDIRTFSNNIEVRGKDNRDVFGGRERANNKTEQNRQRIPPASP